MQLKKTSFLWGLLVFAAAMAALVFAAAPIQMALGMWGVAITEIILLAIAAGAALLLRLDFKETFPFRLPKPRQVIGIILMVLSGMVLVSTPTLVIFYFFPEGFNVATGISNLFGSMPPILSWLIAAVLPAVCEEALHRGVILRAFSAWKSRWAVVFAMGFIFGLFHLDPYRFVATGILGGVLTYIALESGNLALPMLYHLLNNTISVLASLIQTTQVVPEVDAAAALTGGVSLLAIGAYLILSAFAVPVLRGGCALVKPKPGPEETREEWEAGRKRLARSRILAAVLMAVMFVSGVLLFAGNMMEAVESLL